MTVLTMTFIGLDNRTDLPRVSYSTALDIYVAICFVFVLATILQFAAVHYFTKYGCGEGPQLVKYIAREAELADLLQQMVSLSQRMEFTLNKHSVEKNPNKYKICLTI